MVDPVVPYDAVILGGGVTGLTLATLLSREEPSWRITVLEREAIAGGKMRTLEDAGFRIDTGPVGVLPGDGGALDLARELDLRPVPAAAGAGQRWIYRDGGLRPIPTGPTSFLTTELLSPVAKLRALAEPLVPPGGEGEETVHAFLARRFGYGVANRLAEALVLGVTGGDPKELSLDALFPRLRGFEREHGSLVRGLLASGRASRASEREPTGKADREAEAEAAPARTPRGLHGFGEAGMQALTDALTRRLGPALRTGAEARSLAPEGDGWRIGLADGERILARRVAVTVPAFAAADLLQAVDGALAEALAAIPYAPMRVVGLGYDRIDVPHPMDGFGFLVPSGEGVRSLGVLFSSSLFPGQAPPGKAHLRVLTGGRRDAGVVELDADALVASVRRDLQIVLGITEEPESTCVVDWPKAIPQYGLGHRSRVADLMARVARLPGLALAGSAYHGVGVNDCVIDARRVVRAWTSVSRAGTGRG